MAETLTSYAELADILDTLPVILRETRRAHRLSTRAVADQTGVAYSTVWRIEQGSGCSLDNAAAIFRWLDGAPRRRHD